MITETRESLLRSLAIQGRVIHALLMREIITRYGRHNIGFAWLFAEPMMFTSGIVALWTLVEGVGSTRHISIAAFALTSYSTVLIWRNTVSRCTLAIQPNTALLFHRNVRAIDLFFARITLEVVGATLSMIVLLAIFVIAGWIAPPNDMLTMAIGWGLLAWYSVGLGLLIGALTEFSELADRLWHPIAYFQLPISGAFTMAQWLPPGLRKFVMLFPLPNAVELFRYGYFGDTITPYYDIPYTMIICAVLTWLGLLMVKFVASRIEPQ